MRVFNDPKLMYEYSRKMKTRGKTIGFVPTMGALHEGHLSLIEAAKKNADIVVASIFVNPTQFGPGDDLARYPRQTRKDKTFLENIGIDALFLPDADKMYVKGFKTSVYIESLSRKLCGKSRPEHFKGVATVVAKLLNIVDPDLAFFGKKDYQQLLIIKALAEELNFPTKIIGLPTVREYDGLAMSSRNSYLTQPERERAANIFKLLQEAKSLIAQGEKNAYKILVRLRSIIGTVPGLRLEYLAIVDPETLEEVKTVKGQVLVALAANLGQARLIDNILVEEDGRWGGEKLVSH